MQQSNQPNPNPNKNPGSSRYCRKVFLPCSLLGICLSLVHTSDGSRDRDSSSFCFHLRFRQYWFTLESLQCKLDRSRRGDGRKRNNPFLLSASVKHPLVLPSPFSRFTLELQDSSVSASISASASIASVNQALVFNQLQYCV